MKNSLLLLLLSVFSVQAQSIYHAEKNRAEKAIQFQANPNTQNYDMRYQKLELTVNPEVYFISGTVTAQFSPHEDLSQIVLDLNNQLTVTSVKQNNTPLTFTHQNHQLFINLAESVSANTLGEIKIEYNGAPSSANNSFTKSYHGDSVPIIWTLSEPYGAKDWWPCKDDLTDKIDNIEVILKTPSNYTAVANGVEISQNIVGNQKYTHFKHNYPIPAYLVAIAVTNYQVYTQEAGTAPHTFPVVNYLYPESYESFIQPLDYTLQVMQVFEDKFGTYPFANEKYGHAQFGWGGGMEHTTVSFMVNFNPGLVAHELAHHWFGNKVTCGTWKDIWLNEGFAEYATGIAFENLSGEEFFKYWRSGKVGFITQQPTGNLYLTDSQVGDASRIFSSRITYAKGSMVVHMLRKKMGDAVFFQALKNYLNDADLAYGFAVTEQLKNHLEAASNMDLTSFFNNWVYNEGFPKYESNAYLSGGQLHIKLWQTPSSTSVDFFDMPVKIRVTDSNGTQEDHILQNTTNYQDFVIDTNLSDLSSLEIDPDYDIIRKIGNIHLGINSLEREIEVKIIPNPAENKAYIDFPQSEVLKEWVLFDNTGKKVRSGTQKEINLLDLEVGVYHCSVKLGETIFQKKIIKK